MQLFLHASPVRRCSWKKACSQHFQKRGYTAKLEGSWGMLPQEILKNLMLTQCTCSEPRKMHVIRKSIELMQSRSQSRSSLWGAERWLSYLNDIRLCRQGSEESTPGCYSCCCWQYDELSNTGNRYYFGKNIPPCSKHCLFFGCFAHVLSPWKQPPTPPHQTTFLEKTCSCSYAPTCIHVTLLTFEQNNSLTWNIVYRAVITNETNS